ncbi:MAG: lytic murein transglycosylase [Patescibacteria group bacterium]
MRILTLILVVFAIPIFTFAQSDSSEVNARKAELETQLKEYERQIEEFQGLVQGKQKERTSLERDIALLNAKISSAKIAIRSRDLEIEKLSIEINQRSQNITHLKGESAQVLASISDFLRRINETDNLSAFELALLYEDVAEFFNELESLGKLQDSLYESLLRFQDLKETEETAREDLRVKKDEAVELRAIQQLQKRQLDANEKEKQNILKITKGEEARYQSIVQEKQKNAAEIRTQIFKLFGGGQLSFGEAYDIAKIAERATGVRAAFILAVLTQESAIDGAIGANVGKCFYNTPRSNPSGTVMKNDQKKDFLAITGALGLNPDTMPVSCPITAHGSYGGAMGPAQFMPKTWLLYEDDIKQITNNNPPNPWNNSDAFVATALYLKNSLDSQGCKNYANQNQKILPYQFLLERCAAAQYYAGGNWFKFRFAYGDPVVDRADQFQRDINVLSGLARR